MILNTTLAGLLGPYTLIELGEDRAYVDGAEVPYSVVGECSIIDLTLPPGERLSDYDYIDGKLVKRTPPPDPEPEPDPE